MPHRIVEQRHPEAKRVFQLPALVHVHQDGTALAAIIPDNFGFDVYPDRRALLWKKRDLANPLRLGSEDLLRSDPSHHSRFS
jgi:hypothetical protein